jgi:assimilatory nitrate reductase catalytic subunit
VETNSNCVTQSAYDPISREPNFKQSAVKVVKTEAADSGMNRWKI